MKYFCTLLLLFSTLNSAIMSLKQKNYITKVAYKANKMVKRRGNKPFVKFRISKVRAGEDYSLKIHYKGYLKSLSLKKKFIRAYDARTKKRYCKDKYYKRMRNDFKMYFHYFNQNNILITSFYLDQNICYQYNKDLNRILYSGF